MPTIRVNKNKDYTVISCYHLKDINLSLKAKGLLSVMLSLPEDWDYSLEGLVTICKESETAVNSALKELKERGYLTLTKLEPGKTESGRYEYIYNIFEQPQKQAPEIQGLEIQGLENHPLVLDNNIYNNIKDSTYRSTNLINTKVKDKDIVVNTLQNSNSINTIVNTLQYEDKEDSIESTTNTFITTNLEVKERKKKEKQEKYPYFEVIDYLNSRANTKYRATTEKTKSFIRARINEGFTLEDFKKVIDNKCKTWLCTEWEKYLRPETLFGTKFESYLQEKEKPNTYRDKKGITKNDFSSVELNFENVF